MQTTMRIRLFDRSETPPIAYETIIAHIYEAHHRREELRMSLERTKKN